MAQRKIIAIKERIHPQDFSRLFLVQVAVDSKPCVPFWSHISQRVELGEKAWLESLLENGEHLMREYGPAPALT